MFCLLGKLDINLSDISNMQNDETDPAVLRKQYEIELRNQMEYKKSLEDARKAKVRYLTSIIKKQE